MTSIATREPTDAELRQQIADLERQIAEHDLNRLAFFRPYPWQLRLIEMGSTKRERCALAGNRVGKSEAGAYEVAVHSTGEYPPDWKGRRFSGPIVAWVAGDTSATTRDTPQLKLIGPPGSFGRGMIPAANLIDWKMARNVPDAVDYVMVRHKTGGVSFLYFKSFDQGRSRWQGTAIHLLWCDEEPPLDIYSEGIARLGTTRGISLSTLTPLKGATPLVGRFLDHDDPDRGVVHATIDDAEHIDPAERAKIVAGYLPHEREARAKGVPMLGEGRVFLTPEETIACDAFPIPSFWRRLGALDFGIGHPFAAVELAHDADTDTIYVTKGFRMSDASAFVHCETLKGWRVPIWAWPHDGAQRDKGSGEALAAIYGRHGLAMLPERAQFPDGSISFEGGIAEMAERFESGRLKVFRHLSQWFEEYRHLHRTNGLVQKVRDDLLSATRVGLMSIRHARIVRTGQQHPPGQRRNILDFDPHNLARGGRGILSDRSN